MSLNQLLAQLGGGRMGGMGGAAAAPTKLKDTSETIHVSALALLKMLVHGRAGIPLEVMGIMVGEFIDEYTVRVIDVFTVPQSATGQSVEAVDEEYQVTMMAKLRLTGRPENMVGWYHSHPGFGCWLSSMDVETARTYEQQLERCVSIVVDPVQSVRGKVIMDAFRCIPKEVVMAQSEARQITSVHGFPGGYTAQALVNGLNRLYYSMPIAYRKQAHETAMLLKVNRKGWQDNLKVQKPKENRKEMTEGVQKLRKLAAQAAAFIQGGQDEKDVENIGKLNPLAHFAMEAETLLSANVDQVLGSMLNCVVF
jgi:26S proteasome regulatory subunit N11